MLVVSVDLSQLVLSEVLSIERMLCIEVLMRDDDRRVSVRVTRGLEVVHSIILTLLVLVEREVEAALGISYILRKSR
jgi:hypothetical protein